MASRIFGRLASRRLLASGTTLGGGAYVVSNVGPGDSSNEPTMTPAEVQFNTPFGYVNSNQQIVKVPPGWTDRTFKLCNQYPPITSSGKIVTQSSKGLLPPAPGPELPGPVLDPLDDAPWLNVNFQTDPKKYCKTIKAYCWDGNVGNPNNPSKDSSDNYNPFLVEYNPIRKWYHAPWMHASINGREPLNGLTFERPTPPKELSDKQTRQLQTWACGFYNAAGATTFGEIWKDPNNPQWNNVKFPLGTCVFKILMTDATNDEVSSMTGAPGIQAVIAKAPTDGSLLTTAAVRNNDSTTLRLLQVDFAVRDNRAPTGWVFGTYMYDGSQRENNPWDRIIPVGLMWGNDPELTPDLAKQGQKPTQSWINHEANNLRKHLNGTRPSWGYSGRMNGPADYFRSACASCHSTSSRTVKPQTGKPHAPVPMVFDSECFKIKDPVKANECSETIPISQQMKYFRNIAAGGVFEEGDVSGDYSLQLQMGYYNFLAWQNTQKSFFQRTKLIIPFTEAYEDAKIIEAKRAPHRAVGLMPVEPTSKDQ